MGWTSIYQLFWCSPGVQGFDPSPYETALRKKRGIAFHCNTIKVYCINTYIYIYIYICELYTYYIHWTLIIIDWFVFILWYAWNKIPITTLKFQSFESFAQRQEAEEAEDATPTTEVSWWRLPRSLKNTQWYWQWVDDGWWIDELLDWLIKIDQDWSLPFFKAPHDINHHPWLIGHHPRNGCPWRVMKVPGTLNSNQKHTENRINSY